MKTEAIKEVLAEFRQLAYTGIYVGEADDAWKDTQSDAVAELTAIETALFLFEEIEAALAPPTDKETAMTKVQEGRVQASGAITEITAQTTSGPIDYKVNIPVEEGDMCEFHLDYVLVAERLLIALEVLEDHDMLEEANTLRLRAKMKEASEEVSDG